MMCRHVYQNVGSDICPDCGGATHEVNWAKQAELQKQWLIDNPDAKFGGWWSI